MTALPLTTQHRLRKIPQTPSVWEGDRRPTSGEPQNLDTDAPSDGDCILWVDGTEGMVRAMDVVSPEMGRRSPSQTLGVWGIFLRRCCVVKGRAVMEIVFLK